MSRFWERNCGEEDDDSNNNNNNNTKRRRGEKRRGENRRVARDSYQSAYPRILNPGGEQPIRGSGLAGRRDSTAPERYIFKTIPLLPELHLGSSLSLFLSLGFRGEARESRNSRIADGDATRSRRMNALRVQIYYREMISKITLYLLPRTMMERKREEEIYICIYNVHDATGTENFRIESNRVCNCQR